MNKKSLLRKVRKNKMFLIGGIGILIIILLCVFAPLYVQFDATKSDLTQRLLPPEGFAHGLSGHVFGTDPLGRDVLTRVRQE